jgi:hypothetical protein
MMSNGLRCWCRSRFGELDSFLHHLADSTDEHHLRKMAKVTSHIHPERRPLQKKFHFAGNRDHRVVVDRRAEGPELSLYKGDSGRGNILDHDGDHAEYYFTARHDAQEQRAPWQPPQP